MQDKSTSFSIKDWSDDDKPREKLLRQGRTALTHAELIAILIGSGTRNESAVELSKRILAAADHNLNELGKLSVNQLMQFKGIGMAKAVAITAALEIGRRRRGEEAKLITKITDSRSVFELLQPRVGELPHEEFWIIYLNNSNGVIHSEQLSKGGITATLVDVRLVIKQALDLGAIAIILAHNHPSGSLHPSAADKQITKKLKLASEAMDIKVLDHLIITSTEYFSFADNKII